MRSSRLFHLLLFILPLTFAHPTKKRVVKKAKTHRALQAKAFLASGASQFGGNIEGASVDGVGNIFATNFLGATSKAGSVSPKQAILFADTDNNTFVNGIRFAPTAAGADKVAFMADVKNHRVIKVTQPAGGKATGVTFCADPTMVQPNDLAITSGGRLYLSGQNFVNDNKVGDGDLWLCSPDGKATRLGVFGRTNGIEVSPDEKTLYLSEAFNKGGKVVSNVVWQFDLDANTGAVANKRLFVDFAKLDGTQAIDIDGMRTDTSGNLFVARNGGGEVAKFSPKGELLAKIALSFKGVANLEFGGPDGKTMFAVGACADDAKKGCVDSFVNDVAGRAFAMLKAVR